MKVGTKIFWTLLGIGVGHFFGRALGETEEEKKEFASKGRWIGGGDIRLGLLMGVALGWPQVILAIFMAYVIGSIVGLGLIAFGKKQWGSEVPLGTFLSTAAIITMLWGKEILAWYLSKLY